LRAQIPEEMQHTHTRQLTTPLPPPTHPPTHPRSWVVHKELWAFQAIRWVLIRFLVLDKDYNTYVSHTHLALANGGIKGHGSHLQRACNHKPVHAHHSHLQKPPKLHILPLQIVVFYVIAAVICLSLALTAYVAVVLKKDDSTAGGWLSRWVWVFQMAGRAPRSGLDCLISTYILI
jgi:hypothetical protein